MRYFPVQALNFALKDKFRRVFWKFNKREEKLLFFVSNLAAGGAAGAATLSLVYPLDFVRTRLAIDSAAENKFHEFKGFRDCLTKVFKCDGIKGIYRGYIVSIIGVIRYRAMYFGIFDTCKELFFEGQQNFLYMWMLGFFATAVAGYSSYPLDTIRRRMMSKSGTKDYQHIGSIKLIKQIYYEEGMKGFYRGAGINLLRSSGGALVLAIYNKIQTDFFEKEKHDKQ